VQGGAQSHLHRLQIDSAPLPLLAEDDLEQAIYFLTDLLLDRLRRFFSWDETEAVGTSGNGRNRQILSLTSNKA
jgi:hypothetical protein